MFAECLTMFSKTRKDGPFMFMMDYGYASGTSVKNRIRRTPEETKLLRGITLLRVLKVDVD